MQLAALFELCSQGSRDDGVGPHQGLLGSLEIGEIGMELYGGSYILKVVG